MKRISLLIIALFFTLTSCVQKSGKKTIIVKLNVEDIKGVQKVGITIWN